MPDYLLLVALAACRDPAAPARALPDWGDARIAVSGADAVAVDRAPGGVDCGGDSATVRSSGSGAYWSLTISRAPASVWWSRRDRRQDAIQPGPTWVAEDPAGLSFDGRRAVLDGVALSARSGGEEVRIDAVVRCPVAADPVPAAAVDALSRAAGAPAERIGERARAEVEVAQIGSVVDATRGAVGPGVVVYAGAAGEVWVAPGSGAADIVRHARVAGPDAPWVAAAVEGLVRDHRIDVVAADAGSLTARLPSGVDTARLAREVAALCPAVLEAPGASFDALRTQLARDRQLVCWWSR